MDEISIFGLGLILLYVLYLQYTNKVRTYFTNSVHIEPFKTSKTKKQINSLKKNISLLKANIVDLASVAKHNTLNICRMKKSIEEVDFHGDD
tara:strand:+ start:669 stop:944 length:276 start_codon:yes stop_codon:yes gene_type:complete